MVYLDNAYRGFMSVNGYIKSSVIHWNNNGNIGVNDQGATAWGNYPQIVDNITVYEGVDFTSKLYNSTVGVEFDILSMKNGHVLKGKTRQSGSRIYLKLFVDTDDSAHSLNESQCAQTSTLGVASAIFTFVHTNGGNKDANLGFYWQVISEQSNNAYKWSVHDNYQTILNALIYGGIIDDPYGTDENHTPPGGYAGFDYTGDDVDIPALPLISAANSGFVRLYNPTITEV